MKITALGYTGVESPDYKEWEEFGPEILGLALAEPGEDGSVRLRMDDHHHRLAIHPGPANRLAYIGWELTNDDDLASAAEDLARFDVESNVGTDEECEDRRVQKMIWFKDQAGIRQELFVGQLVKPNTFWPGRRMSGFVTGHQGMGHAVVLVPNQQQAKAFYTRVMGFRISDEVDMTFMQFYFLRCNPRHHSFSFGEVPGVRGLHHIMMQTGSLDDVGVGLDLCLSREVPLVMTLGRHTNDLMVSFYLRTPSGFEIEYGWGGLEVDDETWIVKSLEATDIWGHKMSATRPPECVEEIEGMEMGRERPGEGFKWEPRI